MAYIQHGNPFKRADPRRTIGPGKNFNKAKPTGTGGAAGGGMTQKVLMNIKKTIQVVS